MKNASFTTIGRNAIALAVVAILGLVFITLFYTLFGGSGGPFGTLNDICVALGGILSGGLVWRLYPFHRQHASRLSRLALGSGLLGACLAPIGSSFAVFNVTGWFLAGLVTTFGYALIGLWLLTWNYSARRRHTFPSRLALLGMVAGGVTAVGLLAITGIIARIDAPDAARWYVSQPYTLAVWAGIFCIPSGVFGSAAYCYQIDWCCNFLQLLNKACR